MLDILLIEIMKFHIRKTSAKAKGSENLHLGKITHCIYS